MLSADFARFTTSVKIKIQSSTGDLLSTKFKATSVTPECSTSTSLPSKLMTLDLSFLQRNG